MMVRVLLGTLIFFCTFNIQAQEDLKVIKLNPPQKSRGSAIMKAFSERKSVREFSTRSLKTQDLSDLLWAANGINRPDSNRTAPSCRNFQEVELFVILPEGAYIYDAKKHALNPVTAGDYRGEVAGEQDWVKTAPLCIILVADMTKYGNMSEHSKLMASIDVGIVCQNINLACAGLGLATVPRGTMNHGTLRKVLKLTDVHILLMNNPVGYPK